MAGNKLFKTMKQNARVTPPALNVVDYQFNDRISNIVFILAFVFIGINIFLVWLNHTFLPPEIPLYLQRNWGAEQLAGRDMIWLQPGLLVLFFLINYAISLLFLKSEPLTARILGGTVFICSIMSLISVWNIMNLVIAVKMWF